MIKANFNTYRNYVTDSLYQWDINQDLVINGLNLSTAPEIHFANANMDRAIVRQSTLSNGVVKVPIPNSLLQSPLTIKAYIGIYENDTFKIIEIVEIPIIPRTRPTDYQISDTDEEIYSFNRLENEIANMRLEVNSKISEVDNKLTEASNTLTEVDNKFNTISQLAQDMKALSDNTTNIKNGAGGFAAGKGSVANNEGSAIGYASQADFGGAVGGRTYATYGGAVGWKASAKNGFAGGREAYAFGTNSIQLGTGQNQKDKSLQVFDDNIYDGETHTMTIQNLELNGENVNENLTKIIQFLQSEFQFEL